MRLEWCLNSYIECCYAKIRPFRSPMSAAVTSTSLVFEVDCIMEATVEMLRGGDGVVNKVNKGKYGRITFWVRLHCANDHVHATQPCRLASAGNLPAPVEPMHHIAAPGVRTMRQFAAINP